MDNKLIDHNKMRIIITFIPNRGTYAFINRKLVFRSLSKLNVEHYFKIYSLTQRQNNNLNALKEFMGENNANSWQRPALAGTFTVLSSLHRLMHSNLATMYEVQLLFVFYG